MRTTLTHYVVILFLLAAGIRAGWVTSRDLGAKDSPELAYPDEEAYKLVALSLVSGGGMRDEFGFRATYMPGYPAFIALFLTFEQPIFWVRLVQATLGAWVAPASFLLAIAWLKAIRPPESSAAIESFICWYPIPISLLVGLGVALDPFLVFFTGLLLTEALFAALLVSAWLLVVRIATPGQTIPIRTAVAAGALIWACVMLRPSAIVLAAIAPIAVALGRRSLQDGLIAGGLSAAVVVVLLVPWAARNTLAMGEWHWLSTRGGISLYDGFREGASGESDLAHTKTMPEARGLGEADWDRLFRHKAYAFIRENPGDVLRLAGQKFRRTWNIVPNEPGHRRGITAVVSAAYMIVVLVTAGIGLWTVRRWIRWWIVLLLPVAAFTMIHMVYVGSVRYRGPIMPFVVVLSGIGVWRLVPRRVIPRWLISEDQAATV